MNCLSFHWIIVTFCIFVHPEPASSCGGLLTGRTGEIKTPNFPRDYDNNLDCTWTIKVENGETIVIEFLEFKVEPSILFKECADTFSVYDGADSKSPKLMTPTCGDTIPGPLYSSGHILTITFTSDWRTRWKGVHLKWKISDKFALHTDAKTWTEANSACMIDGGHLAVKTDLNVRIIVNLVGDRPDSFWIGEYYTPWIWLQGCYKDSGFNVTASKSFLETKQNEAKVCQYYCRDSVYFGMKGFECYCLTTEDMDKLIFSRSVIECNTPCSGNENERCGGAFSLTVYMNDVCWENSSTWVTKISKTISGITCQAWSSDFPHAHPFHDDTMFPDGSETLASNYCRDPDGRGAPWCFTTDPNVPWQFCDAPPCPGTCWSDPTRYAGHLNVTVHGHKCRNWTDTRPSFPQRYVFPDSSVSEAANFCRSPDADPLLWCFLDSEDDERWEFCGSPPCFDTSEIEETGELCRLFWAKDNKFYYKEHRCNAKERFWCYVDKEAANISVDSATFYFARKSCNLQYSLANYRTLYGLVGPYNEDELKGKNMYWLGNFRGKDDIYSKDRSPTPSACKTITKTSDGLATYFHQDCQLAFHFICQKDALLCGDKFYNDSGSISSPDYPDNYENNEYCEWEIIVSEGRAIEILFHEVEVEHSRTCSFDYIEVYEVHMNSSQRIGQKLCGKLSNVSIVSGSNHVTIKFRSDKEVHKKGFYLEWTSEHLTTTSKKGSGNKTSENITDKRIDGDSKTGESTLSGATLAGIIIGVLLALVVVVVIVLVVLVLRRKKQQKTETETIMQLKALESTSAATTPSNAETPQQDVYSSPIPKALRQPKQSIPEKATSPDTDDTYYHHLHQSNVKRPSPDDTGNPYQGLHSPELYDHTSNSKPNRNDDMQLKALEGASAAPAPSNAETPQQDVYRSPIHKALRQPNQPISEKATVPDTDNTYYHHLHQTNVKRPSPDDTGNPYQGLHSTELYDHTLNSKPNQTDYMYDHFDSNKTDSLDNAGLQQNQNVYDCTTSSVAPSNRNNTVQAGKTGLLDKERNEIVGNEYMSMNSNNESGKQSTTAARTDNYLTPIGDHINDLTGHAANADIQENYRTESDGNDKEVHIEEDTYYNVTADKSNEHAGSDQHLYEMDDAGQVYETV